MAGHFEERHPLGVDSDSIDVDHPARGEDPPVSRHARLRLSGDLNVGTDRDEKSNPQGFGRLKAPQFPVKYLE